MHKKFPLAAISIWGRTVPPIQECLAGRMGTWITIHAKRGIVQCTSKLIKTTWHIIWRRRTITKYPNLYSHTQGLGLYAGDRHFKTRPEFQNSVHWLTQLQKRHIRNMLTVKIPGLEMSVMHLMNLLLLNANIVVSNGVGGCCAAGTRVRGAGGGCHGNKHLQRCKLVYNNFIQHALLRVNPKHVSFGYLFTSTNGWPKYKKPGDFDVNSR